MSLANKWQLQRMTCGHDWQNILFIAVRFELKWLDICTSCGILNRVAAWLKSEKKEREKKKNEMNNQLTNAARKMEQAFFKYYKVLPILGNLHIIYCFHCAKNVFPQFPLRYPNNFFPNEKKNNHWPKALRLFDYFMNSSEKNISNVRLKYQLPGITVCVWVCVFFRYIVPWISIHINTDSKKKIKLGKNVLTTRQLCSKKKE